MLIAVIREEDCVGCAKCLPACPVDAIIGAHRFLHTVLTDECIGCKLCISPCPMDCIEMIEHPIADHSAAKAERAHKAKRRYQARQKRLILNQQTKLPIPEDPEQKDKIRAEIKAAVKRIQQKRAHDGS